jgi:hypothetical protein
MTKTEKKPEIISDILNIIENIKKGDKFFLRNIVITPVYLEFELGERNDKFTTLDEALSKKYSIKIMDSQNIDKVEIENRSPYNFFVMDGEQLVGGLQNRMFVHSFTVEPNRKDKYDVRCIEAGRWQGSNRIFNSQNDLSYTKLRLLNLYYTRTKNNKSQEIIWKEIDNKSKSLNYYSKTSSLTDLNRFMDNFTEDYIKSYNYSGENGYIVEHNDNLISIEILNNNSIVQKIYKKMLKSYIYDAFDLENEKPKNLKDIKREIPNLRGENFRKTNTETEYRLYNDKIEGKFYRFKNELFHLTLFNNRKIPQNA